MDYILTIGTNMGDREVNIYRALNSINSIPYTDIIRVSSIYETEPVGYARQDNFYNCVVLVESQYEPHEMLGICLGIEAGFGRKRGLRFGPRILDIDIIFAQDKKIDTRNLTVPHPRYHERRFVLQPMLEILEEGTFYGIDFKRHLDLIEGQEVTFVKAVDDSVFNYG